MAKIIKHVLLLVSLGMLFGGICSAREKPDQVSVYPENPVTTRGLTEESIGKGLIEKGIEYANLLAVDHSQYLLHPSWLSGRNKKKNTVALVYLVSGKGIAGGNAVGVPRDCLCVFVQMSVLEEWIAEKTSGPGRFELDKPYLLTFMFLHELGHLHYGHHAVDFAEGKVLQLNIEPSIEKERERQADEFAAKIIRLAVMSSDAGSNSSLEATFLASELTKLSWNLQATSSLDYFGSGVLGSPEVFFDSGYSHPNLSWRILQVNNLIQQTKESRRLLENFEQSKSRGASPDPLFEKSLAE